MLNKYVYKFKVYGQAYPMILHDAIAAQHQAAKQLQTQSAMPISVTCIDPEGNISCEETFETITEKAVVHYGTGSAQDLIELRSSVLHHEFEPEEPFESNELEYLQTLWHRAQLKAKNVCVEAQRISLEQFLAS